MSLLLAASKIASNSVVDADAIVTVASSLLELSGGESPKYASDHELQQKRMQ
jgi:hypothetical protein